MDHRQTIFVFGSNEAGRHGKGAALYAKQQRGAVYGQGEGLQGYSYAIPTKDGNLRTLEITVIAQGVQRFIGFAAAHPDLCFEVTPIGCGLAGYEPKDIAPLFVDAPDNCQLPEEFMAVLGMRYRRSRDALERDLGHCITLLRKMADALCEQTPEHPLIHEAKAQVLQVGRGQPAPPSARASRPGQSPIAQGEPTHG
jgi:hypothetical protein